MNTTDPLYQLIHVLNRSEKRHFKLYISRFLGEKQSIYLKLFDAFNVTKNYNAKSFKLKNADKDFVKKLSYNKNYLYNSILDFLNDYHKHSSSSITQVNRLLHSSQILFKKRLFKQAEKLLTKAQKQAEETENFTMMMQVTTMQMALSENLHEKSIFDHYLVLSEKRLKLIDIQSNYILYDNLFKQIKDISLKKTYAISPEAHKKLEELINHPFFQDYSNTKSVKAKEKFLEAHIRYHYAKENLPGVHHYLVKKLELHQANPQLFIKNFVGNHVQLLSSVISSDISTYNWEAVPKNMKRLKALHKKYKAQFSDVTESYYQTLSLSLQSQWAFVNGDFASILQLEPAIRKLVEEPGNLTSNYSNWLCFDLAAAHFAAGKTEEALNCTLYYEDRYQGKGYDDVIIAMNMLRLMVHAELKNYRLLSSLALSADRHLKKTASKSRLEADILSWFRHFDKHMPDNVSRAIRLNNSLEQYFPAETTTVQIYWGCFFIAWLESKITDQPIQATYKMLIKKVIDLQKESKQVFSYQ